MPTAHTRTRLSPSSPLSSPTALHAFFDKICMQLITSELAESCWIGRNVRASPTWVGIFYCLQLNRQSFGPFSSRFAKALMKIYSETFAQQWGWFVSLILAAETVLKIIYLSTIVAALVCCGARKLRQLQHIAGIAFLLSSWSIFTKDFHLVARNQLRSQSPPSSINRRLNFSALCCAKGKHPSGNLIVVIIVGTKALDAKNLETHQLFSWDISRHRRMERDREKPITIYTSFITCAAEPEKPSQWMAERICYSPISEPEITRKGGDGASWQQWVL